ncbi:conserved hypothetical protein [Pseudomonas sp. 8Z]|nr:conserved hypothetical protein [Pseudomonas sp. 8Z]
MPRKPTHYTCPDCFHTWEYDLDGTHSCTPQLRAYRLPCDAPLPSGMTIGKSAIRSRKQPFAQGRDEPTSACLDFAAFKSPSMQLAGRFGFNYAPSPSGGFHAAGAFKRRREPLRWLSPSYVNTCNT